MRREAGITGCGWGGGASIVDIVVVQGLANARGKFCFDLLAQLLDVITRVGRVSVN